jgi:hypothetical protein
VDFHELCNGAEFHHLLGMGFMPTEEAEHHTLQVMFRIVTDFIGVKAVVPISEVIPSRGVRAVEGEGRGLSHLEVIARGRLWR